MGGFCLVEKSWVKAIFSRIQIRVKTIFCVSTIFLNPDLRLKKNYCEDHLKKN